MRYQQTMPHPAHPRGARGGVRIACQQGLRPSHGRRSATPIIAHRDQAPMLLLAGAWWPRLVSPRWAQPGADREHIGVRDSALVWGGARKNMWSSVSHWRLKYRLGYLKIYRGPQLDYRGSIRTLQGPYRKKSDWDLPGSGGPFSP